MMDYQREYMVKHADGGGFSIVYFFTQYECTHAKVDDKRNFRRDDTSRGPIWIPANSRSAISWSEELFDVSSTQLEEAYQAYLADLIVGKPPRMWDRWKKCWIDVPKSEHRS